MMKSDSAQAHTSLSGLREFVLRQIAAIVPSGATVADMGTGTGKLAQMLSESGYLPTAVDRTADYLEVHGIPFVACDLNAEFAGAFTAQFDVIVGTELIEHLENPRNFLRQCRLLLKDTGWLFLTTPNIDNPVSKALFVRHDHFLWFSDKEYAATGHITPVGRWYLEKAALDTGFRIDRIDSFGCPYAEIGKWPKMRLLARLLAMLAGTPPNLRGEILYGALRKQ